jgi:hypothetical protein
LLLKIEVYVPNNSELQSFAADGIFYNQAQQLLIESAGSHTGIFY